MRTKLKPGGRARCLRRTRKGSNGLHAEDRARLDAATIIFGAAVRTAPLAIAAFRTGEVEQAGVDPGAVVAAELRFIPREFLDGTGVHGFLFKKLLESVRGLGFEGR